MTVDVAVVGGGHAGLTAAAYCAAAGMDVVVLEALDAWGGACRTAEIFDGLSGSLAATWFGMLRPEIREELGLVLDEKALWADALIFDDEQHWVVTQDETSEPDAFASACFDLARLTLVDDPLERRGLFLEEMEDLRAIAPLSVRELCTTLNLTPYQACSLAIPAVSITNCATDRPGSAMGAVYMACAETAGKQGKWGYLAGGMGDVPSALVDAGNRAGAKLLTSAPVQMVERHGDDFLIRCEEANVRGRAVVMAVHPVVSNRLVQGAGLPALSWDRRSVGMAAMVHFRLRDLPTFRGGSPSVDVRLAWECPASYCPSLDYLDAAWAEFVGGATVSSRPIVSLAIPPPVPAGRPEPPFLASAFVQYVSASADEREILARVLEVIGHISANFEGLVDEVLVLGPHSLDRRTGIPGGHPEHLDMGDAFARPEWFTTGFVDVQPYPAEAPRLLHAGAACFPGGTVTGATGRIAAKRAIAVLNDSRRMGR